MNNLELNKLVSINLWLSIADYVQKLNISNGSVKEKEKNLMSLIKFLEKKEYVVKKEEVVSLIDAIYNLNCNYNYKKAYFYEQICSLKDLKVDEIAFMPNDFIKNVIKLTDKNKKTSILKSAFTNGIFNIRKWENDGYKYYSIINLEDANYVIVKIMDIEENRLVNVKAYLKDFNGIYPNKSVIKKFKQSKLLKIKEELYREKYNLFNRDEISCKNNMNLKLGKKQKNNQYYYEKY